MRGPIARAPAVWTRTFPSALFSDCVLQVCGGFVDSGGNVVDDISDHRNLLVGFFPFLFVHEFADSSDWFSSVSGVGAGSVDLVFEPGTPREPFVIEEETRDAEQVGIHSRQ